MKSGIIISAIQRDDTHGSRDLYVSFWDGEKASVPINMGRMINTEFEELFLFLADELERKVKIDHNKEGILVKL